MNDHIYIPHNHATGRWEVYVHGRLVGTAKTYGKARKIAGL